MRTESMYPEKYHMKPKFKAILLPNIKNTFESFSLRKLYPNEFNKNVIISYRDKKFPL